MNKPKVIQIERPEFLPHMLHEPAWVVADEVGARHDLKAVGRPTLEANVRYCQGESVRGPTFTATYVKCQYLLHGSLVHVDQAVSRDLEISTVVGDLNRIAYPNMVMEIRFADPGLPAVLVCRIKNNAAMVSRGFVSDGIMFAIDTDRGACLSLSLPDTLWPDYVANQFNESMAPATPWDMGMEADEAQATKYMVMMAVKVLAYSSVPQLAPQLLTTKAERKAAGIHPKHIIPEQSVYAVRYLPRVLRESDPRYLSSTQAPENNRTFKGRAGCIRHYQSERYVNVRGTWQWLPPIPPPEGIQVIYKVRKPVL